MIRQQKPGEDTMKTISEPQCWSAILTKSASLCDPAHLGMFLYVALPRLELASIQS